MGHRQQKVSLLVLYFVLAYECLFQLKRSYNEDQHKKNTLANNHHLPVGLGFNKQHPPPHQLRRGIKNKEIKKYQRFPHSKLLKNNHKSIRTEDNTSELQSLMSISHAVFCSNTKYNY